MHGAQLRVYTSDMREFMCACVRARVRVCSQFREWSESCINGDNSQDVLRCTDRTTSHLVICKRPVEVGLEVGGVQRECAAELLHCGCIVARLCVCVHVCVCVCVSARMLVCVHVSVNCKPSLQQSTPLLWLHRHRHVCVCVCLCVWMQMWPSTAELLH